MIRTAAIGFPITLFLAWLAYVTARAGNGPGLKWDRIPNEAEFTVAIVGVPYLIFVAIALIVLYFTDIRGGSVGAWSVIAPALLRFTLAFGLAIVVAIPLGELYCLADERAFRREAAEQLKGATIDPKTNEYPLISRRRWWPAGGQTLVSDTKAKP